jgi:hypothetical protein
MKLTPEKLTAFTAVLSETCNVGKACKAIDITRMTAYNWRAADEVFAAAWDKALVVGVTALEDEAHRRAFEGSDEPVFHQGAPCGSITKYSDTLSIFLLKAHAPEKYRENSHLKISGKLDLSDMSEADMRAELALLTAAGVLGKVDDGSDLV